MINKAPIDAIDDAIREIIKTAAAERPGKRELAKIKKNICKKHGVVRIPTDVEILFKSPPEQYASVRKYFLTKPVRTLSGVATIAVATKPLGCPHGKCSFCPGGVDSAFGSVPQSYTGLEPSIRRSALSNYDPYAVVFGRLSQYIITGHVPEKVELIIQGATFPAYPKSYQFEFVRSCFLALNDFSRLFFGGGEFDILQFKEFVSVHSALDNPGDWNRLLPTILHEKQKCKDSFETVRDANENAKIRCVGLTIETKPDFGFLDHGNQMLELGCTRVEIGVQSPYDDVLLATNRGHTSEDTKRSIQILRDLGFKLNFHVMPGLPGVSRERDARAFEQYFSDAAYKPDMLKVYPCMVMKGTALFDEWKRGTFVPISTDEAAERIVDLKKSVAPYCRVMRVQRDIPTAATEAGVDRTNLRQYIVKLQKERGVACRCIRCSEPRGERLPDSEMLINVLEYEASGGSEYFIHARCGAYLLGFVRLRLPKVALRSEITNTTALIREIHVYGKALALGARGEVQHSGIGAQLLERAEAVARASAKLKIVIISAVGARSYFKKFGYNREGPYMIKMLESSGYELK
ncbi:MAG: tRNA uridine(34) 5-carboxymethylaminomethyl modification radical SAM/GNAT enzyme Elp3 [Planctomycetota bacterium]